jgi:sec-independent protein translocase protein TatA
MNRGRRQDLSSRIHRASEKEHDMIGGIGMPELLLILVIVLVIFGAGKLPEIGSGLGKGIRNFKKATSDSGEVEDPGEKPKIEKSQEDN